MTIKLKQLYQVYLEDTNSPEYKELSGNVEQAVCYIYNDDFIILWVESPAFFSAF